MEGSPIRFDSEASTGLVSSSSSRGSDEAGGSERLSNESASSGKSLPRRSGQGRRSTMRRSTARASFLGGVVAPLRGRRTVTRRPSVHQDMSSSVDGGKSQKATGAIKRQFYGLELDTKKVDKVKSFMERWTGAMMSFATFNFYFFIGGCFYYNVEGWTALDCLYFQTVTMTTVGYGDFSPTTKWSRIFTVIYIFIGIGLVGRIVNDFAEYVVTYAEAKAKSREEKQRKHIERLKKKGKPVPKMAAVNTNATELRHYSAKIMFSLGSIFLCLILGSTFYHINEDWYFSKAFYFCVVTMTTVGYGDTALTKRSSRAFAVFYIISSCVLVTLAIGNLAGVRIQIITERKKLKMLNRKLDFNFIRELDNGESRMDKTTFLVAMLVQQELVDKKKDCDPWLKKFDELDKTKDGLIDFDECIDDLEREERERMRDIEEEVRMVEKKKLDEGHDLLGNLNIMHLFENHESGVESSGVESGAESGMELVSGSEAEAEAEADYTLGYSSGETDSFSYVDNPLHPGAQQV